MDLNSTGTTLPEDLITLIPMDRMTDMLKVLRIRPEMYLGEKSLKALHHFVDGMILVCQLNHLPWLDFDFDEFDDWVRTNKAKHKRSMSRSFKTAQIQARTDTTGFDLWFSWYDEFMGGKS